jgi:uncharacterized protein YvpB
MEDDIQFNPSAFKHGFTEADIRKVIETKIYEGQLENFVNKYTIIGFDTAGNLLEIMYNIIDSESVNIFHAMKCRKSIINQLKTKRGDRYGAHD